MSWRPWRTCEAPGWPPGEAGTAGDSELRKETVEIRGLTCWVMHSTNKSAVSRPMRVHQSDKSLTFNPPIRGEEKEDRGGLLIPEPGHCLSCQVRLAVRAFVRVDLSLTGQTEAGRSSLAGGSEDDLVPERRRSRSPRPPQLPGALTGAGHLLALPDSGPQVL